MMQGVAQNAPRPGLDYRHARESVALLHRAGVPIVLGTDANQAPGVPADVPHGQSAHRELELLVEAGLSAIETLRAATGLAAAPSQVGWGSDQALADAPGRRSR